MSDPIFVPHAGEHLTAMLTLPEQPARGVAVFPLRIPPLGIAGATFWAQAARRLAERGIASARFECAGSGDSTGELIGGISNAAGAAAQALTVAELAMSALGLDSFSVAGSCFNGAVALGAARDPRCIAAVSIETPGAVSGLGQARRRVARWGIVGAVRTRPALRRALLYDRVRLLLRDRTSPEIRASLERSSRSARVLLIHDRMQETRRIAEQPGDFEVRSDIPFGSIRIDGAELTPGEEQVLAVVVDWLSAAVGNAVESKPLQVPLA